MKTLLLTGAIGVFLLAFFGWRMLTWSQPIQNPTPSVHPIATSTPTPRVVPAKNKEYKSNEYRFSLVYPEHMRVTEHQEPGRARTIVFQNPEEGLGFQIFIVPYGIDKVTPERFKIDVPSGVMKEPTNTTVDGVFATKFFSEDAALGETREVWFIHNNFLYEVTAPKQLDAWLTNILSTWKFL